jgi:hypothetical protein
VHPSAEYEADAFVDVVIDDMVTDEDVDCCLWAGPRMEGPYTRG